jgi:DNA-binding IclR family transcriptional regulator
MTNDKKYSSLDNALRILNLYSAEQEEFGVHEAAEQIGVTPSTAHRLLNTLRKEGFLVKDANQYRLGVSILALGAVLQSSTPLIHASHEILKELSIHTNETAQLGIRQNGHVLYVNGANSPEPIGYHAYEGQKFPLHTTSAGKILLAQENPEAIQHYFQSIDQQRTYENVEYSLEEIRTKKYAITNNEPYPGVTSVSSAVKTRSGKTIAAIEVIGPSQRFSRKKLPQFIKLINEATEQLSQKVK